MLPYPSVGPESPSTSTVVLSCFLLCFLSADLFDGIFLLSQALEAFSLLSRTEGIIPALETSHAIAHLEVQGIHTSWRGSPCTC